MDSRVVSRSHLTLPVTVNQNAEAKEHYSVKPIPPKLAAIYTQQQDHRLISCCSFVEVARCRTEYVPVEPRIPAELQNQSYHLGLCASSGSESQKRMVFDEGRGLRGRGE